MYLSCYYIYICRFPYVLTYSVVGNALTYISEGGCGWSPNIYFCNIVPVGSATRVRYPGKRGSPLTVFLGGIEETSL